MAEDSKKKKDDQVRQAPVKPRPQPVIPFKAFAYSDKMPAGTDLLVAKIGGTGFLAWSTMPMYRNDLCTMKVTLPVTNETVESRIVVFKCYDRYGVGRPNHDQNFPHLSEFVFYRINDPGVGAFNRFVHHIDTRTGLPLDPEHVIVGLAPGDKAPSDNKDLPTQEGDSKDESKKK